MNDCNNCYYSARRSTCPVEGCFEIDNPDEYFGWKADYETLEKQVLALETENRILKSRMENYADVKK